MKDFALKKSDLVLAVREADLGLVLDDVVDLVELAHPVEDVVGAGEVLALAHRVHVVGRSAPLVVEAGTTTKKKKTELPVRVMMALRVRSSPKMCQAYY